MITASNGFRVGAAQTDITPLCPMVLVGMGGEFVSLDGSRFVYRGRDVAAERTHDPLTLQILWIEDNVKASVLLAADLLYPVAAAEVCNAVAHACGISAESVFYTATHNHNGPCRTDSYAALLVERATAGAKKAMETACPARMEVADTEFTSLIYNRSVPLNGVKGNLSVLSYLAADSGQPVAMVWNYGCHPCSLSSDFNQFSADYPGALRSAIYEAFGRTFPVLFLTDCSGNVQPIGLKRFRQPPFMYLTTPKGDVDMVSLFGRGLAAAGLEALNVKARSVCPQEVQFCRFTIRMPVEVEGAAADLEQRREEFSKSESRLSDRGTEALQKELARVYGSWIDEVLLNMARGEALREVEAAAIVNGDVAIVMLPLEPSWEIGAEIRKSSPFSRTLFATTSLAYDGYLANEDMYKLHPEERPYEAAILTRHTGFTYTSSAVRAVIERVVEELRMLHDAQCRAFT